MRAVRLWCWVGAAGLRLTFKSEGQFEVIAQHRVCGFRCESLAVKFLGLPMSALMIENNCFGIQCAQVARGCQ
ncbi:hypothetical protein XI01_10460 [Bradyrhizobium sp. CCBAU 21360]|nr:hypothetical protein [Bradyrhizobium sp. CCBAU 21360]